MYLSIVVFLLLCKVEFSEGIIAGTDAEPGEFPFIVSLRNETNKHYCGGSLITRRHIVTAAHCLFTDRSVFDYELAEMYESSVIKVVVDTTSSEDFDGEFYQASELSSHPQFNVTNPFSVLYDIGIIQLSREITNGRVIPIHLPTEPVTYGKMGTVAGWGIDNRDSIQERSKISRVLQKADMEVMQTKDCIDVYLEQIPDFIFIIEALLDNAAFCCVQEHANACYRDSGSPLTQDGKLVGVVISGNECKQGSPDIFTSVFHYQKFILDCIDDRCPAITDVKPFFERTGL